MPLNAVEKATLVEDINRALDCVPIRSAADIVSLSQAFASVYSGELVVESSLSSEQLQAINYFREYYLAEDASELYVLAEHRAEYYQLVRVRLQAKISELGELTSAEIDRRIEEANERDTSREQGRRHQEYVAELLDGQEPPNNVSSENEMLQHLSRWLDRREAVLAALANRNIRALIEIASEMGLNLHELVDHIPELAALSEDELADLAAIESEILWSGLYQTFQQIPAMLGGIVRSNVINQRTLYPNMIERLTIYQFKKHLNSDLLNKTIAEHFLTLKTTDHVAYSHNINYINISPDIKNVSHVFNFPAAFSEKYFSEHSNSISISKEIQMAYDLPKLYNEIVDDFLNDFPVELKKLLKSILNMPMYYDSKETLTRLFAVLGYLQRYKVFFAAESYHQSADTSSRISGYLFIINRQLSDFILAVKQQISSLETFGLAESSLSKITVSTVNKLDSCLIRIVAQANPLARPEMDAWIAAINQLSTSRQIEEKSKLLHLVLTCFNPQYDGENLLSFYPNNR